MSDLFKKLNTLINAKVHGALNDASDSTRRRLGLKSGPNVDKQIKTLRNQIDKATAYEEELQGQVNALSAEVSRLDKQADDAVRAGDEDTARQLIARLQRAQQRLTMAESDLNNHRLAAEELIRRVNDLEMAVASARQSETGPSGEPSAATPVDKSKDVMETAQRKIGALADLMAEKKDHLSAYIQGGDPSRKAEVEEAVQQSQIEDDLAARRQRLSKS